MERVVVEVEDDISFLAHFVLLTVVHQCRYTVHASTSDVCERVHTSDSHEPQSKKINIFYFSAFTFFFSGLATRYYRVATCTR